MLGSQYVLGLRARQCTTGSILDRQQIQAARQEDVLNALSQIVRRFRTRAGESPAAVEKQSPLPEATTSSIEALKAYSIGARITLAAGQGAGIPYYRRAVELDPEFAMAHASLGMAYSGSGESVLAAEHTAKAWRLRDRVSDREEFYIDFTYDRQVTGNLEKAYQTLELWFQTLPRMDQPNPQALFGRHFHSWDRPVRQGDRRLSQGDRARPGFRDGVRQSRGELFPHRSLCGSRAGHSGGVPAQTGFQPSGRIALHHWDIEGRPGGCRSGRRPGQGQAQDRALDHARAGARARSCRPAAGGSSGVGPRRGSRRSRRRARGGSDVPGRTGDVGGRVRERSRRGKARDGGGRAVEGPGRRVRGRPGDESGG